MSAASPASGLADRLVDWMAANRESLDALMAHEGSRAVHEEFILAEGGTLPDRGTRIARARAASARAWMRHLAQALSANWRGASPDLSERLTAWMNANRERLEALVLEEEAIAERRGASGDPVADRRDGELAANARLFAEVVATLVGPPDADRSPAEFGRDVAVWSRANAARRREVEREALAAWGAGVPPGGAPEMSAATAAPESDEMRVQEAAAVWAHVRVTAEALEAALEARPEAPA